MEKLNLHITKPDDFFTIAPLLQDAIVPRSLMHYDPYLQEFSLQLNRFCHEHTDSALCRVNTQFHINHVEHAEQRGFSHDDPVRSLHLLTLKCEEGFLYLMFSDHKQIRLLLNDIDSFLWDYDDHWHTDKKPTHVYEH